MTLRLLSRAALLERSNMKISVDLSQAEIKCLEARATHLGVRPEDLARAALSDLLAHPKEDFEKSAQAVLEKNEELYRRLSK